jgi:hypothetical protein
MESSCHSPSTIGIVVVGPPTVAGGSSVSGCSAGASVSGSFAGAAGTVLVSLPLSAFGVVESESPPPAATLIPMRRIAAIERM